MLFALLLLASAVSWVPARWPSSDPTSLELLAGTPVNCLLIEKPHWSAEFNAAARKRGISTFAVRSFDSDESTPAGFTGLVFEGDQLAAKKGSTIQLRSRARMQFDDTPVVGTTEGVWPGIVADEGGSTKAAPSGAPWVNTNSGFLRFARAAAGNTPVWIANRPPANTIITAERYMQAIADAAITGARWVLALDNDFFKRLLARDAAALKDWKRITDHMAYFESHPEWREMAPYSLLAVIQDVDSGALLSGGVLDMIAVKHTPVRTVPARALTEQAVAGAKMAVNVAPAMLTDKQREVLRAFARSGATTLNGPPSWKFPAPQPGQITLSDADVKTLDEVWKEMNSMTGRRNLGVRLFNVSSMLSNLLQSSDGSKAVLHLVNYSGYPVENVTVHLLGKYKTATLLAPGAAERKLELYEVEDGSGVDIDTVGTSASLLLER